MPSMWIVRSISAARPKSALINLTNRNNNAAELRTILEKIRGQPSDRVGARMPLCLVAHRALPSRTALAYRAMSSDKNFACALRVPLIGQSPSVKTPADDGPEGLHRGVSTPEQNCITLRTKSALICRITSKLRRSTLTSQEGTVEPRDSN